MDAVEAKVLGMIQSRSTEVTHSHRVSVVMQAASTAGIPGIRTVH